MGIPIRLGRTFYPGEKNAVIVSESFARQQWPSENPLGQKIGDDASATDVVVGVAGDAHINAVGDDDAMEEYRPAAQADLPAMTAIVRSSPTKRQSLQRQSHQPGTRPNCISGNPACRIAYRQKYKKSE